MVFRPTKTEAYRFELPTIPPIPCPSPTLQYTSLNTALVRSLPKDSDPELRSLTCSYYSVFSLPKNPKVTGVSVLSHCTFPEVEAEVPRNM